MIQVLARVTRARVGQQMPCGWRSREGETRVGWRVGVGC